MNKRKVATCRRAIRREAKNWRIFRRFDTPEAADNYIDANHEWFYLWAKYPTEFQLARTELEAKGIS